MAQFIILPPYSLVETVFIEATGRPLLLHEVWTTWSTIHPDHLQELEQYIRPCHRSVLHTVQKDPSNPIKLLRQLLRQYGFLIQASKHHWVLIAEKGARHVTKKEGTTITWESPEFV